MQASKSLSEFQKKIVAAVDRRFDAALEELKALVRIPSVSFGDFDPIFVRESAQAVARLFQDKGFDWVEVLGIPGKPDAHPYVYAERLKAPGAPTLLLYAHHDVQPPGRSEIWKSKPFEPVLREGPEGLRLYGRGTADDKAGIIVHTASVQALLDVLGELPVNVKLVIEGEEEAGSEHLPEFLKAYRDRLDADAMVLTDAGNFDCGIPALTVALRGMVGIEVEVRALTKSVHSGMWGGPLPDPVMALSKILATLVDENGKIAISGVREQVRPLTAQEEKEYSAMPYDEAKFREQSGLIPSAQILKEGPNPLVQLFRMPSLTVNAIQASARTAAGNIINDVAWAKVTIRLVPDMDPQKVLTALQDHLRARVPWGLEIAFKVESCSPPWSTDASGPVFAAAERALGEGYGHAPYKMGCGGSIPFVQPFSDALGGAPAILVGVEDPHTNAHGENESLLVADFKRAIVSQAFFFAEVAELAEKAKLKR